MASLTLEFEELDSKSLHDFGRDTSSNMHADKLSAFVDDSGHLLRSVCYSPNGKHVAVSTLNTVDIFTVYEYQKLKVIDYYKYDQMQ